MIGLQRDNTRRRTVRSIAPLPLSIMTILTGGSLGWNGLHGRVSGLKSTYLFEFDAYSVRIVFGCDSFGIEFPFCSFKLCFVGLL